MTWFPLGPSFNFLPRDPNYLRLSSQNAFGMQGTVTAIAIHPTLPSNWLVVDRPDNGGSGLWLTVNSGDTWTPVLDAVLASSTPGYGLGSDPTCVSFHPNLVNVAYFGCGSAHSLFISHDGGASWTLQHQFSSFVRKLVINPTTGLTAATESTTQLWAVLNDDNVTNFANGIYYSTDNGVSWIQTFIGLIDSFAPNFQAGAADAFAGQRFTGVVYSATPHAAGSWSNLATGAAALPAGGSGMLPGHGVPSPTGYQRVLVARVPSAPNRVYVLTSDESHNNLYRSNSGSAGPWTYVVPAGGYLPAFPQNGFRNFVFAISPASPAMPASGSADVLFTGGAGLGRSTDGGATWHEVTYYHADVHALVFDPATTPAPGVTPLLYLGCDGGLGRSTLYGGMSPTPASENFNEGAVVDAASGVFANWNRGRYGSCVFQFAAHPAMRALNYMGCQDTGVTAGGGSLTWRTVSQADAGALAVTPSSTGVTMWYTGGLFGPFPYFWVSAVTDNGETVTGPTVRLGAGGPIVGSLSNYLVNAAGECIAGLASRDDSSAVLRHTIGASTTSGVQWVTLDNVAGIQIGGWVTFTPGFDSATDTVLDYNRQVLDVDTAGNRISVNISSYADHSPVSVIAGYVGKMTAAGIATAISQDLTAGGHGALLVGLNPASATAICATWPPARLSGTLNPGAGSGYPSPNPAWDIPRVFTTTSGTSAPSTWTQAVNGVPSMPFAISSVAVASDGSAYVLLSHSVTVAGVTTPLFHVSGDTWQPLACNSLPSGLSFGKLIGHPSDPAVMFASLGGQVYRLDRGAAAVWTWTEIGGADGSLPGDWVVDLWAGNVAPAGGSKILLRAAVATRGLWECDVTPGAIDRNPFLYVRDNLLDDAWLDPSPVGPNPLNPSQNVYWWQSPDIKVETAQPVSGQPPILQTDPPAWNPATERLPHDLFGQVRDYSQNLEAGRAARVHVQIHNRCRTAPVHPTQVILLFVNAGAVIPNFDAVTGGGTFSFWPRFAGGAIDLSAWPANARWQPIIGGVEILNGITADNPMVVSRDWTVPPVDAGSSEAHYCIAVIVNNVDSPVTGFTGTTDTAIDHINRNNPQIGQKNLHVVAMQLPGVVATAATDARLIPASPPGGRPMAWQSRPFAIEFNAPAAEPVDAELVFDLKRLHAEVRAAIEFPAGIVPRDVTGLTPRAPAEPPRPRGFWADLIAWLLRLLAAIFGRSSPNVSTPQPSVFDTSPSAEAVFRGVSLTPGKPLRVRLALHAGAGIAPGSVHEFDILQRVRGEVVGGSTYRVTFGTAARVEPEKGDAGENAPHPIAPIRPLLLSPPWMRDHVLARLIHSGRIPWGGPRTFPDGLPRDRKLPQDGK